jgi:hypothetical protein
VNRRTVSRIALSLICLLLAGETLLWLFGAAYGYGYRGFSDKGPSEKTLIAIEMTFNGFVLIALIIGAAFPWRRKAAGRWLYFGIAAPALTPIWWSVQCGCAPLEFVPFLLLSLVGMTILWTDRHFANSPVPVAAAGA